MDSSASSPRRTTTMYIFMVIYEKNKPILYHNSSKEEIMLVLLLLEEGRRHYGRRKAYTKKEVLHHLFFCIKAFAFVSSSSSASSLCSINPSKRAIHENKYTFFLRLHILFNNTLLCGDEEEACYILLSFLNLMQYTFFETQFTQLLKTLLFLWKTFLENNKLNYLSY